MWLKQGLSAAPETFSFQTLSCWPFLHLAKRTHVFAELQPPGLVFYCPPPHLCPFSLFCTFPLHCTSKWPIELMCLALGQKEEKWNKWMKRSRWKEITRLGRGARYHGRERSDQHIMSQTAACRCGVITGWETACTPEKTHRPSASASRSVWTARRPAKSATQARISAAAWAACWWIFPDVATPAVHNTARRCTGASASQGFHRPSLPSCPRVGVGATAQQKQKKEKKKHKPSRAEQTGFTELLSSQAPIPSTALVAHSLSRGLWAVKYGFMCAHITFGTRETFKSNYSECYLHDLLF